MVSTWKAATLSLKTPNPYNCNSDEVEKDDEYNGDNASILPLHLEEENLDFSGSSERESRDKHLSDEDEVLVDFKKQLLWQKMGISPNTSKAECGKISQ